MRCFARFRLVVAMVALSAVMCSIGQLIAAEAAKPNVLLIMADDLRCALGCYGDKQALTPNIDRLAARGVRFDRAYVQYTLCNPSRSSMLTGLRPQQTGVMDNEVGFRSNLPDAVTMPQLLREHGSRAESYGKILHVGSQKGKPRADMYDLGKSWDKAEAYKTTPAGATGQTRNLAGNPKEPWCVAGPLDGTDEDQPDYMTAHAVISAIDRLGNQPWFIGAGFFRPHDPFIVPKKYWDLYPYDSLTLWRDPSDATPLAKASIGVGRLSEIFAKFTDRERLDFMRGYYGGVSFTDANVGRLMDELDKRKLWDNTVVIFVGDHGYHLGERNWWNKGTLFDRCCRAPMIICAPGMKSGVARGLVEFIDLYPTVADLCGLKPPAGLAGRSLRTQLEDPSRPGKPAAFTVVKRGQVATSVRTERWRYTPWTMPGGGVELYDHDNDPEEMHNLADDPQYATVISELKALLP